MLALELLLLPLSPIPKRTAKLLQALGECPAVSGIAGKRQWNHLKYLTDNSKIPDEVENFRHEFKIHRA